MRRTIHRTDRWCMRIIALTLMGFLLIADATAQTELSDMPRPGDPVFWADAAVFRGETPGEGIIEVSYKVLNVNLTYVQRDDKFIASYDFIIVTPHTITDPAAFLDELEETLLRGYAIDNQENELGGRCVAAPIFDYLGKPVAAISMSVPIQRFPEDKFPEFGEKVKQAAQTISLQLGANLREDN